MVEWNKRGYGEGMRIGQFKDSEIIGMVPDFDTGWIVTRPKK